MTIAIKNLSKVPQTILLPRHLAPQRMDLPRATHNRDGVVTKQTVRVVLPDSRSILPGDTATGLPDELAQDDMVLKGKKAGIFQVIQETAPAEEKAGSEKQEKASKAAVPPEDKKRAPKGSSGNN